MQRMIHAAISRSESNCAWQQPGRGVKLPFLASASVSSTKPICQKLNLEDCVNYAKRLRMYHPSDACSVSKADLRDAIS